MPLAEINSEQSGESSQEEYEPDPTKSPLNKSISNLSNEWTPVKPLSQICFIRSKVHWISGNYFGIVFLVRL